MSGILFLGDEDFVVRQGDKGLVLSLTYESKGLNLVLFYSTECPYCINLINKFKQLPLLVNGCQFAMVNVNRNMNVIEKSKNTIAPIQFVPDVILYVNGMPYIRYDGPHDIQHIKNFIVDIYKQIQKTSFMEQKEFYENQKSKNIMEHHDLREEKVHNAMENVEIPAYTVGVPLYGEKKREKVCYLNYNTAYTKTN